MLQKCTFRNIFICFLLMIAAGYNHYIYANNNVNPEESRIVLYGNFDENDNEVLNQNPDFFVTVQVGGINVFQEQEEMFWQALKDRVVTLVANETETNDARFMNVVLQYMQHEVNVVRLEGLTLTPDGIREFEQWFRDHRIPIKHGLAQNDGLTVLDHINDLLERLREVAHDFDHVVIQPQRMLLPLTAPDTDDRDESLVPATKSVNQDNPTKRSWISRWWYGNAAEAATDAVSATATSTTTSASPSATRPLPTLLPPPNTLPTTTFRTATTVRGDREVPQQVLTTQQHRVGVTPIQHNLVTAPLLQQPSPPPLPTVLPTPNTVPPTAVRTATTVQDGREVPKQVLATQQHQVGVTPIQQNLVTAPLLQQPSPPPLPNVLPTPNTVPPTAVRTATTVQKSREVPKQVLATQQHQVGVTPIQQNPVTAPLLQQQLEPLIISHINSMPENIQSIVGNQQGTEGNLAGRFFDTPNGRVFIPSCPFQTTPMQPLQHAWHNGNGLMQTTAQTMGWQLSFPPAQAPAPQQFPYPPVFLPQPERLPYNAVPPPFRPLNTQPTPARVPFGATPTQYNLVTAPLLQQQPPHPLPTFPPPPTAVRTATTVQDGREVPQQVLTTQQHQVGVTPIQQNPVTAPLLQQPSPPPLPTVLPTPNAVPPTAVRTATTVQDGREVPQQVLTTQQYQVGVTPIQQNLVTAPLLQQPSPPPLPTVLPTPNAVPPTAFRTATTVQDGREVPQQVLTTQQHQVGVTPIQQNLVTAPLLQQPSPPPLPTVLPTPNTVPPTAVRTATTVQDGREVPQQVLTTTQQQYVVLPQQPTNATNAPLVDVHGDARVITPGLPTAVLTPLVQHDT